MNISFEICGRTMADTLFMPDGVAYTYFFGCIQYRAKTIEEGFKIAQQLKENLGVDNLKLIYGGVSIL